MIKHIKKQLRKLQAWARYYPPYALSSKAWRSFDAEFKEHASIRYWFKTALYNRICSIKYRYRRIADWVTYRTIRKYHIINTDLTPGYYDPETLMLNVNFTILKNFVEVDTGCYTYTCEDYKKTSWAQRYMPFYRVFLPFRRPDIGVRHFEWASTLDDPNLHTYDRSDEQARVAREILVLYRWWTINRPGRQELEYIKFKDQGLGIMCFLDTDFDHTAEDYLAHKVRAAEMEKQQAEWEDEDTQMLIRLINIRKSLWI